MKRFILKITPRKMSSEDRTQENVPLQTCFYSPKKVPNQANQILVLISSKLSTDLKHHFLLKKGFLPAS